MSTSKLLFTTTATGSQNKEAAHNTALTEVEGAIAGALSVSVTSANQTLTTAQGAQNVLIKATGNPGASRHVVLPIVEGKLWLVSNNISTAQVVTFKTSGGSGVALAQNEDRLVWCDGTDIVEITAGSSANTPSAGEKAALAGTSGTPGSGNKYVTDADPRLPSTGENDALAGTSGTPSSSNKYVTDGDSRNANARTPTAHASSHYADGADPSAGGFGPHFGCGAIPTGTSYLFPGFSNNSAGVVEHCFRAPFKMRIDQMYVEAEAPAGGGVTFTLNKNLGNTSVTCTVAATATQAEDTTHSADLNAGDRISVEVVPAGGYTGSSCLRAHVTFRYRPIS